MEISISRSSWDEHLTKLLSSHEIVAPLVRRDHLDYYHIDEENLAEIIYCRAKPVSPLKAFFLPVKENVTMDSNPVKPLLLLGVPSCDLAALALLDAIYLDEDFPDPYYSRRRENSILISTDCHTIQENCHCTSYGIDPGGSTGADLNLAIEEGQVVVQTRSPKGEQLIEAMGILVPDQASQDIKDKLNEKLEDVRNQLKEQNPDLPDLEATGKLVNGANEEVWRKFSSSCVSCGACSAICPTCTCFLLIDRPGFEKVHQLDTCQHPGFERVAGGEDPLHILAERFRNRYMCKYVWRPEQHGLHACTGCGRCTETCIGQIDKNELILSLSN